MDGLARPHHVDRAAADSEPASLELDVVAGVFHPDQLLEKSLPRNLLTDLELDHGGTIILGRAETVDTAHRRDDEDVPSGEKRLGRPMPEPIDLLVDGGVLLDVEVDLRNVRLGLVVVVVADEVLDRVLREERPELAHELGGERLVGADDQGRSLKARDRVRHRERLAASGHPEQGDEFLAPLDALHNRVDRGRLVALGHEVRLQLESPRQRRRRPLDATILRHGTVGSSSEAPG